MPGPARGPRADPACRTPWAAERVHAVSNLPESLAGKTVAVLGGTGPQGRGLARRFAAAGVPVVIGSRSAERAAEAASTLAEAVGGTVTGADNAGAAAAGDIVVLAVPWDGHGELLASLTSELA